MNRQDLLTLIQLTDAELDRLLRKMGQPDLVGADDIPEQVASLIVKNFNRVQQHNAEPEASAKDEGELDEVETAWSTTQETANLALNLAANVGALTGNQFVETFAKSFTTSATTGLGKFQQQLQQQMQALDISCHNVSLGTESPKTLEAQAKSSSPVLWEQQ